MTEKQADLLAWLRRWFETHEHAPSLSEMAAAIGATTKSLVHRRLEALERDGYIRRRPYQARGLELTEKGKTGPLREAVAELIQNGIVKEDEDTGLATVTMDALGAVELAWREA